MKDKPIKWGYKVFKACDAETAYVYRLRIYTGKQAEKAAEGLSYSVTMDMVRGLEGCNRVLYCDNWYTGVKLFHDLRDKGILACGTVRTNRKGFPIAIGHVKKLDRGQSQFRQRDKMVATVWYDKRPVYFLSTAHNAVGTATVNRRTGSGERIPVACPPAVKAYTSAMGGVDRSNRETREYTISRKSKKWWMRMFFYLVDTSIFNAFVLYHSTPNVPNLTILEFRESLMQALCADYAARGTKADHISPTSAEGKGHGHYHNLSHWPKYQKQSRDCHQCSKRSQKRKKSSYICEKCGVTLCVDNCFKLFHTNKVDV